MHNNKRFLEPNTFHSLFPFLFEEPVRIPFATTLLDGCRVESTALDSIFFNDRENIDYPASAPQRACHVRVKPVNASSYLSLVQNVSAGDCGRQLPVVSVQDSFFDTNTGQLDPVSFSSSNGRAGSTRMSFHAISAFHRA